MMGTVGSITSMGNSPDHIQALERELASLKSQLQVRTWLLNFWIFYPGMFIYVSWLVKIIARIPIEASGATTIGRGTSSEFYAHVWKAGFRRENCSYNEKDFRYQPFIIPYQMLHLNKRKKNSTMTHKSFVYYLHCYHVI